MAICKDSVLNVYNQVIEDVIAGSRGIFADEGLDKQILSELKALWESKLLASKAVDINPETTKNTTTINVEEELPVEQPPQQLSKTAQQQVQQGEEDKLVAIQIALQTQPGKVLTIKVPSSVINGNQLQTLLSGPIITATMQLPEPQATSILQYHINNALENRQQLLQKTTLPQVDGAYDDNTNKEEEVQNGAADVALVKVIPDASSSGIKPKIKNSSTVKIIRSVDGIVDSSDEDVSSSDSSGGVTDEEKEFEDTALDDGAPEETLNSDDDVTDDDETADMFDTDNVVVCQFEKIMRNKNKWKFILKDGIMNLDGKDYVFQKATGDADW